MFHTKALAPPLLTIFLAFPTAFGQDPFVLPPYEGPKECPYAPDTMGYTNTTVLHIDMVHEAVNAPESQDEYRYILCPFTTFEYEFLLRIGRCRTERMHFDGGVESRVLLGPITS
mmetsp:Transcript_65413/g.77430  ORF Transcript_65413/g.77430 Transcript_65413/m.77430 type:complete len:115 (-) Transcript_65413:80-424(-)